MTSLGAAQRCRDDCNRYPNVEVCGHYKRRGRDLQCSFKKQCKLEFYACKKREHLIGPWCNIQIIDHRQIIIIFYFGVGMLEDD
ncbi:uncharacterized protein Dwil_GK27077 [Drosophila willistoni]|uniref:Uncharacterized protein n=1 Tax=Drosophila willistoni TaxID=7260 RepID=A0A0Q9WUK4_DROWI|nr:uncharacterized protein Dwil_GK27077 [Drosophila willistoni]